jgi:hypothetical protein
MGKWSAWVAVGAGLLLAPSISHGFSHAKFGAVSATIGGMQYFADEDSRRDASARFYFGGTAEYSPSERWAVRMESGFGWNSYPKSRAPEGFPLDPYPVKVVSPTVVSGIRRLSTASDRFFYAGGGVGVYYWRFKISGKVQTDPEPPFGKTSSGKILAFDPGVHALAGYEHALTPSVSLQGELLGHYVFSSNEDDRPTMFNGDDAFGVFRVGVKLYFDVSRFQPPEEEF